ncbi:MAG: type I-C CRISPR-associated protein Cas8c/Csd1 [Phycisphaerae bacterium]|nr:type I-C CRISPR-associated protein Cas8c/Csd1 [Phycisphaerae bacterium]
MLHALIDYARNKGIDAEAGFAPKTIKWLLTFTETGEYLGLISAGDPKRGRTLPKVPHLQFSGDTPMRQFLVDTASYAVRYAAADLPEDQRKKLLRKHRFFLDMLRAAASVEPVLAAIAETLGKEETILSICKDLEKQTPKAKPQDNITFAIVQEDCTRVIAEESTWHDWWRGHFRTLFKRKKAAKSEAMRCLVTGDLATPCRTHPKIKGLGDVGGNIETTLVGFDKGAFCSLGLKQSANAAMTEEAAQQYAAALNDLLAHHSKRLVGARVVYWYVGDVHEDEDVFAEVIDGIDFGVDSDTDKEDQSESSARSSARDFLQKQSRAGALLDAIRAGKLEALRLRDARYCAMTLSGNAGRVVVRDWMEGQFEELAENVASWFADLSIVRRDGVGILRSHKLNAVMAAPVRQLGDLPGLLATNIWTCAVRSRLIPEAVAAQTLRRVQIDVVQDEPANHARLGLLRAFCNRNERMPNMSEELDEKIKEPAYVCGQIMALLAQVQRKALGDVGAGVVQRYYAAASATPALVLGRLVRLAQVGHLPKIEPEALRHWLEDQLSAVWNRLKQCPPKTLTLEGQTLFAMGYYQQLAKRHSGRGSATQKPAQGGVSSSMPKREE